MVTDKTLTYNPQEIGFKTILDFKYYIKHKNTNIYDIMFNHGGIYTLKIYYKMNIKEKTFPNKDSLLNYINTNYNFFKQSLIMND